jgi:hypothetical protein
LTPVLISNLENLGINFIVRAPYRPSVGTQTGVPVCANSSIVKLLNRGLWNPVMDKLSTTLFSTLFESNTQFEIALLARYSVRIDILRRSILEQLHKALLGLIDEIIAGVARV